MSDPYVYILLYHSILYHTIADYTVIYHTIYQNLGFLWSYVVVWSLNFP